MNSIKSEILNGDPMSPSMKMNRLIRDHKMFSSTGYQTERSRDTHSYYANQALSHLSGRQYQLSKIDMIRKRRQRKAYTIKSKVNQDERYNTDQMNIDLDGIQITQKDIELKRP